MELGGVPQKIDEYFHLGPIFYVCSSARNWLSFMYKSIYHLCNSLWGVATLDVWSSSTRTLSTKKQVTRNDQFLFILYFLCGSKKTRVFQAHRRVPPTTGVVELWKKKLFCNENQWNSVCSDWVLRVYIIKLMNMKFHSTKKTGTPKWSYIL